MHMCQVVIWWKIQSWQKFLYLNISSNRCLSEALTHVHFCKSCYNLICRKSLIIYLFIYLFIYFILVSTFFSWWGWVRLKICHKLSYNNSCRNIYVFMLKIDTYLDLYINEFFLSKLIFSANDHLACLYIYQNCYKFFLKKF